MAERTIAAVLKTAVRATVPWVRIPLPPPLTLVPCHPGRSTKVSFSPWSPVIPLSSGYPGVWGRPISSLAIPHLPWCESWERNGQAIGQCGTGPQREDPEKAPRRRHAIPDGLALCEKVLGTAAHHRGQAQGPGTWSLSRSVACSGPQERAGQSARERSPAATRSRRSRRRRSFRPSPPLRLWPGSTFAENLGSWRSVKHGAQWSSTLATYAFPTLGALTVNEITRRHVVDALSPIWTSKPETARRGVGRAARRVAGRPPLPRCTCFGCAARRPIEDPMLLPAGAA